MGSEGVHIVEKRVSWTACWKSSCLLDLGSIPNSHTKNPITEKGNNCSKTMEKQKQTKTTKSWPTSYQTWFMGRFFLFFFSRFCYFGPKVPKSMEKPDKPKNYTPYPLASFWDSLFLSLWVEIQKGNIVRQNSSKKGWCFPSETFFVECHIILLGNSSMTHIQHFLKKWWYSFEQTCSFQGLNFHCII